MVAEVMVPIPTVHIKVITTEVLAQPEVRLKAEVLIPEIWLAEHRPATEAILTAIETEVILAEQVNKPVAEMDRAHNLQPAEDNQLMRLLIETATEEMLIPFQLEEEPAEPILLAQPTEVDLSTAIRNIRIAREILSKPDTLVLPAEAQVVQFNLTQVIDHDIKDLRQHKADQTIKDQLLLRADNIASLHKPILVLLTLTEVQALQADPILHQQTLTLAAPTLLQAEAVAILQAEVQVPEVPVV